MVKQAARYRQQHQRGISGELGASVNGRILLSTLSTQSTIVLFPQRHSRLARATVVSFYLRHLKINRSRSNEQPDSSSLSIG